VDRVLVIGAGGAGKTALALRLGDLLDLPVIHLDSLYWRPGWQPTPQDEWQETVERLTERATWVMDGNYGGTLDLRLTAADTVIFVDRPRHLCLWRILKRRLRYRGQTRPDMALGCPERLTPEFLRYVWSYPSERRPQILSKLERLPREKEVFVLRSDRDREVQQFLAALPARTEGRAA
jgi:adenylate kinase family enzyme